MLSEEDAQISRDHAHESSSKEGTYYTNKNDAPG